MDVNLRICSDTKNHGEEMLGKNSWEKLPGLSEHTKDTMFH